MIVQGGDHTRRETVTDPSMILSMSHDDIKKSLNHNFWLSDTPNFFVAMSSIGTRNDDKRERVQPQTRLEPSVSPQDGSLLTAPLSLILNAATDGLYQDLHNMTNGELTLAVPVASANTNQDSNASDTNDPALTVSYTTTRKKTMPNFSFQERRHIVASTISKHAKSLAHVSALVAAYLPQSATRKSKQSHMFTNQAPNLYALSQIPNEMELANITTLANSALMHVRKSWVSADEAQDVLYLHHGTLWKTRSHPHDVLGAMQVLHGGTWLDLSQDVDLGNGAGSNTLEDASKEEVTERVRCAVRKKLVLGEVGKFKNVKREVKSFEWKKTLEQQGTVLRLQCGKARLINDEVVYPIEAKLTILSEDDPAPWTLLSIRIKTTVKTGESTHQLEMSKEQMFHFHKICAATMNKEENRTRILNENAQEKDVMVSSPLNKLLCLSQVFSLSWQMEILSNQAEALRKGLWSKHASALGKDGGRSTGIEIAPVEFFDLNEERKTDNGDGSHQPMAIMAIHFWNVDDSYGQPQIAPLTCSNGTDNDVKVDFTSRSLTATSGSAKRLTLEVSAVPKIGIRVRLSGGDSVMSLMGENESSRSPTHLRRNVEKLLSSVQDPFCLSISDSLLSATVICAERRCQAVVDALLLTRTKGTTDLKALPSWMHLKAECGTISIGVNICYDSDQAKINNPSKQPVLIFRLACDSRTGQFISTFPRAASLIRLLACNDPTASEVQLLRQAKASALLTHTSSDKRRAAMAGGKDLTGRAVRDAFVTLARSMDILGRRAGIGGTWENTDPNSSPALREKTILQACGDVCESLMTCSAITVVYGVGALAAGVATGTNAVVDM